MEKPKKRIGGCICIQKFNNCGFNPLPSIINSFTETPDPANS
jgi:hypothetical protein